MNKKSKQVKPTTYFEQVYEKGEGERKRCQNREEKLIIHREPVTILPIKPSNPSPLMSIIYKEKTFKINCKKRARNRTLKSKGDLFDFLAMKKTTMSRKSMVTSRPSNPLLKDVVCFSEIEESSVKVVY